MGFGEGNDQRRPNRELSSDAIALIVAVLTQILNTAVTIIEALLRMEWIDSIINKPLTTALAALVPVLVEVIKLLGSAIKAIFGD